MNADWQLLKVFRRGLWMCVGIEVVLTALIAMNDIRRTTSGIGDGQLRRFMHLSSVLSLTLRIGSRLNAMPFPVSVKQRVWLPAAAFAILWGSGIVTIFISLLLLGSSLDQWPTIATLMLQRTPLYVLGCLFAYRFLQLKPYLMGFLFVIMLCTGGNRKPR